MCKVMKIRVILDGARSPESSMAADESLYILHSAGAIPSTLRLWSLTRSAVMLGKYSKTEQSVFTDETESMGIPTIRRFTGGGVTFNDSLGDVGWTYVSSGDSTVDKYKEAADAVHEGILSFGIHTEFNLSGGICVGQKKISGLAGARSGNTILVHGTLLFDPDLAVMDRVLRPLKKIEGVPVKPASIVTSLSALIGRKIKIDEVEAALNLGFMVLGDMNPGHWTSPELLLMSRLEPLYRNVGWNFRM